MDSGEADDTPSARDASFADAGIERADVGGGDDLDSGSLGDATTEDMSTPDVGEADAGAPDVGRDVEDASVMEDMGVDMGGPARTPMFIGVGNWGLRHSSSDGITWTQLQNAIQGNDHTPDLLRGVGAGEGTFIAVGGDRNSMVMRTTDGVTWEEDLHPGGRQWLGDVAYGDGVWVAAGGVGTNMRSTDDGLSWTQHPSNLSGAVRSVGFGGSRFVAVGDNGLIAVSEDGGQSWTEYREGSVGFGSVAYGAGVYVVVGSKWNGSGFDTNCVFSTDTTSWTTCPFSSSRFTQAVAADGMLVVRRAEGLVHTTDGVTWTELAGSFPDSMAYSMGTWIGSSYRRRWRSSAVDSGWMSEEIEGGFRDIAGGWVITE